MNRTADILRMLRAARALVDSAMDLLELLVAEMEERPRKVSRGNRLVPTELDIARARRALRGDE